MEKKSISILGCGWLGLPLASYLVEKGYEVKGSTTSSNKLEQLKELGITPYYFEINENFQLDEKTAPFFNSDILLVAIPPKRTEDVEQRYPSQIEKIRQIASNSKVKEIIFISATSVYPDLNREVVESDACFEVKSSGKALLLAEQCLQAETTFRTTILRLAGLIGYERNPGRFLAGKENLPNPDAVVNLVHQDDCISIIEQLISKQCFGNVYNVCAPLHPTRMEFYTIASEKLNLTPPQFDMRSEGTFKIINSNKLAAILGYEYKFQNPLEAL
jgi:nucleoside-diphosphate-sugar epimerase